MKHFLLQLSYFSILVIFSDFCIGKCLQYGETHAKGGDTERTYYINNKTMDDILLFGSSRSTNHYVTSIIEDSLGIPAYNCGENETGIICFYPKLNHIKKRHTPKIIICDIYTFDLLDSLRKQNIDFLKTLKNVYGNTCVDTMFHRYDPTTKFKMQSNMYRYNSQLYSIVKDNIHPFNCYDKGFYTLNTGRMNSVPVVDNSHKRYSYDLEKLRLLKRLIVENKDSSQIFFTISPIFGTTNDEMYVPVKKLCKKYNIPLFNHLCDTTFTKHMELFGNANHLNQHGATIYTNKVVQEIKQYLKTNAKGTERMPEGEESGIN